MTTDPRITPSVLARLRAMPARARNAILVLLAAGGIGGGVVVVDRTRPDVRPPPVTEPPVRPPPVDPGTRPPPTDPGTRPPPVTPPPSTELQAAVWEHPLYVNAPGDLTVRDSTFGEPITPGRTQVYSMWGESGNYAGQSLGSTEWGAWGDVGLAHAILNMNGPPQVGVAFRNCAWAAAPHPDGSPSSMRWAVRGFGLDGVIFDACQFPRGMGAGIQVALRAQEQNGNYPLGGVHTFERLTFTKIGDSKSERWGAFTISEHGPEGYGVKTVPIDVLILDCRMVAGHMAWTDTNGNLVQSPRGIVIQGRKKVVIRGLHMDYPKPYDGWAIQLWDITDGDPSTVDVTIENSYVREGRIELRNCGTAVVAGVTGGANLAVGTHTDDSKPFPMSSVTFQGPASGGYKSPVVK